MRQSPPEAGDELMARVNVGVNGYGVIGKRVADAVALQSDMKLVGISDVIADYRIQVAMEKGFSIYASTKDAVGYMRKGGIKIDGTLDDLLGRADVIVDCTPAGIGAKNRSIYQKAGVKAIFQGGEKHDIVDVSFVAQCNYEQAIGKNFIRVVSCNTTGLCRVLGSIDREHGIKKARAVLFRRATDPWESHKGGIINTVVPETHVPSHQGPDAQTVLPELNVVTMAAKGPYNLSHIHFLMVELKDPVQIEEVTDTLAKAPRILLIKASDGLQGLNSVIELMRDLGRPRGDLWEVAVWEDIASVVEDELYLTYQVHNESIVVPENIDAIRAAARLERNGMRSIRKTNEALGIVK
jgi:glyceraldehyde-3-phosphate dehydrogenase (NAD(P))